MFKLVQTNEVEGLKVQQKEGNSLLINGYVGCYSDHEGCTSMERIKGTVEVSLVGDKIDCILSDDLELISSEYDGVEWEDLIEELEHTLRMCFKIERL